MKSVSSEYRSPTLVESLKIRLKTEIRYLPHTIGKHPVKTGIAGIAFAYAAAMTPSWLHKQAAHWAADGTLDQAQAGIIQTASLNVLGVRHSGEPVPGHAQLRTPDTAIARVQNLALQHFGEAGKGPAGCHTVTMEVEPGSGPLQYLVATKITRDRFNTPDFAKGDYKCVPDGLAPKR